VKFPVPRIDSTLSPQTLRGQRALRDRRSVEVLRKTAWGWALILLPLACGERSHWWAPWKSPESAHEASSPTPAGAKQKGASTAAGRDSDAPRVVDIAFDVLRIEWPIESQRESRKIWNHADEIQLGSEKAALLSRNGLRIGAVSAESWPAIQAILEACRADTRREQLYPQRGEPLLLQLSEITSPESMFLHGADRRLVGKTFSEGRKLMVFDYALRPELGGSTDLGVQFEIRHDRGEMTWEAHAGSLRQAPAIDRHVFAELSTAWSLRKGESLLIGPSPDATNEYLVGNRFLLGEHGGQRTETLYCVSPVAYQSPSARRDRP